MRTKLLAVTVVGLMGCMSLDMPGDARLAQNSPEAKTVAEFGWPTDYNSWAMDQAYSAAVRYDWNSAMINFQRAYTAANGDTCYTAIAQAGYQAAEATKRSGVLAFSIYDFNQHFQQRLRQDYVYDRCHEQD